MSCIFKNENLAQRMTMNKLFSYVYLHFSSVYKIRSLGFRSFMPSRSFVEIVSEFNPVM